MSFVAQVSNITQPYLLAPTALKITEGKTHFGETEGGRRIAVEQNSKTGQRLTLELAAFLVAEWIFLGLQT